MYVCCAIGTRDFVPYFYYVDPVDCSFGLLVRLQKQNKTKKGCGGIVDMKKKERKYIYRCEDVMIVFVLAKTKLNFNVVVMQTL